MHETNIDSGPASHLRVAAVGSGPPALACLMPFKDKDGNLLETCDVSGVYKEWKEAPSVRLVALRADRLFESSKSMVPNGGEKGTIKFNIKDAVHNQFVLKPLLERMSQHDHHPVPYVKDLAREKLLVPIN